MNISSVRGDSRKGERDPLPGAALQLVVSHLTQVLRSKLRSLGEQKVRLTTEPPLQPYLVIDLRSAWKVNKVGLGGISEHISKK